MVAYFSQATGALKGDGTVSYEDPFSAASAVEWFNNKEWKG
jgi:RNA-binding protein FUS